MIKKLLLMNFEKMSNRAIAAEIGRRIEQLRLEQNLTQEQVAQEIGLTRVSYRNLINGGGKFENLIGVLRVLGHLDALERFMPETPFSPMEQLKMRGKKRRRASGRQLASTPATDDNELDW